MALTLKPLLMYIWTLRPANILRKIKKNDTSSKAERFHVYSELSMA